MSEKKAWKDLGAVTLWDTDNKGVKRKDKNGKAYAAGTGVLTVNGQMVRVFLRVSAGARSGSTLVQVSQPPTEDAVS